MCGVERKLVAVVVVTLAWVACGPRSALASERSAAPSKEAEQRQREVFDRASEDLSFGHVERARRSFLALDRPGVLPSRRAAARSMAALATRLSRDPSSSDLYLHQPDARAAFVTLCGLEGIFAGVAAAFAIDSDDAQTRRRWLFGGSVVGGAAAAAAAYWATDEVAMPTARVASTSLGSTAGLLSWLALMQAFPDGLKFQDSQWPLTLFGASVVGGAAGFLLSDALRPSPGQVAAVSTLTSLGTVATGLLFAVNASDGSGAARILLAGGALSAVGASYMALRMDWSPARAGVVFAGGGIGALLAGLSLGVVGANRPEQRVTLGMLLGAAAAGYATRRFAPSRHIELPSLTVSPNVHTGPSGRPVGGLQLGGRF